MCGIFCCLLRNGAEAHDTDFCKQNLQNRGPDSAHEYEVRLEKDWQCLFQGFTLWTQGENPMPQPLVDSEGNIFLWNGDIFYREEFDTECDTEVVFKLLVEKGITELKNVCGPYAFIYYEGKSGTLWFGRDVLGRSSLLWEISNDKIILSSVGCKLGHFSEVPSSGLFGIPLISDNLGSPGIGKTGSYLRTHHREELGKFCVSLTLK